jgi:hypothetical protein
MWVPLPAEPLGSDPPDQVCVRCSKPILAGNAAPTSGPAIHLRCLVWDVRLKVMEQRERLKDELLRARAARRRAEALFQRARRVEYTCPICHEQLDASRAVLFQGDQFVHDACARAVEAMRRSAAWLTESRKPRQGADVNAAIDQITQLLLGTTPASCVECLVEAIPLSPQIVRQAATDLVAAGTLRIRTHDCPVCFTRKLLLYAGSAGAGRAEIDLRQSDE